MNNLNNDTDIGRGSSGMVEFPKKAISAGAAADISLSTLHFRFLPFLLGAIASQKLNIGGEIYVGEMLALIYLIVKFGKFNLLQFERRLLGFAFIWFCAQLVSDLINATKFLDALKGTLAPLVFGCTIFSLIDYFKNNINRLPAFLLGAACGELIYHQLFPSESYLFNPWKWGLGGVVLTIFVVYFSFLFKKKKYFYIIWNIGSIFHYFPIL